jgi:acyl carrier protein
VAASQEEIIAGLAEIIEEVTGIEPSEVTLEKSFVDDLDIDSLSMVEIAVQTEDKYGVKVSDEDLIAGIAEIIEDGVIKVGDLLIPPPKGY